MNNIVSEELQRSDAKGLTCNEVSEWGKKTGHRNEKTIIEITEGRL